jgi:predicted MPP superfamily phosphohydrolase
MNTPLGDVAKWRRVVGFTGRSVVRPLGSESPRIPQVVEYRVAPRRLPNPPEGATILYFSDLHWHDGSAAKFTAFPELVQAIAPDWIVFGGDLATYACHIRGAFDWLRDVFSAFPDVPKFAVPGNWDRRRKKWLPSSFWRSGYERAGFRFLINERVESKGVLFHCLDEFRGGHPVVDPDTAATDKLNCWISHSIDALADGFSGAPPEGANVAICGHSHGGQVRIPLFGALTTSSKYGKKFEYGLYELKTADFKMIVSSGLGESRFPLRMFCPPEIVVIEMERSRNGVGAPETPEENCGR